MAECSDKSIYTKLDYSIHSYSSYSTTYVPENIKVDNNTDQTSRWSSDSNFPPQYLILKLEKPAIVKSITFGKFEKTHVCNLKKFKIWGGLDEHTTIELLEWGLKNDSVAETFDVKCTLGEKEFPCMYVKIEPHQSWGPSFNFSIWYVELKGTDEYNRVLNAAKWLEEYRDLEITKLCMKHFRQKNKMDIFDALQRSTNISLEHPLLTRLFNTLVHDGDYEKVEEFMTTAINDDYLNWYITQQDYEPVWKCVTCEGVRPGMRGGHQMCLDTQTETIYLLGGWDGSQDLSDFWSYSIKENKWTLICSNVECMGGPSPRSCHKLCLDPDRRQIFVLGRYLDQQLRHPNYLKSDFYVYNIDNNSWTVISLDTASVGGPRLIFDHQMCLDSKNSKIYVFGGRVLTPCSGQPEERQIVNGADFLVNENLNLLNNHGENNNGDSSNANNNNRRMNVGNSLNITVGGPAVHQEQIFSGLYSYHIPTNVWTLHIPDSNSTQYDFMRKNIPDSNEFMKNLIQSRAGHSMLFHPEFRKLYIFAGQRNKEYLNDFLSFNVDTNGIEHIQENIKNKDTTNPGFPASGFTRRATIDPNLNEIYVLSGLSKEKEKRDETVQNSFWVYQINKNQWSCVYKNENSGEQYWNRMQHIEPCPRFAHQLVYDSVNKVHYLFGGNPGKSLSPRLRLDDFWRLTLTRPNKEQLLRKCKILIRKCKFQELSLDNKISALNYLQTSLSELINHEDNEQSHEFRILAQHLFIESSDDKLTYLNIKQNKSSYSTDVTHKRSQLYNELSQYFPQNMTQPKRNLQDLISF